MNVNTSAAVAAAGSNAGLAGSPGFKVDVTRGELKFGWCFHDGFWFGRVSSGARHGDLP